MSEDRLFGGAYAGRRVLVTGHTGFKGSWLSLWLCELGATVVGYALEPPTEPSLFESLRLERRITHILGDVRDADRLRDVVQTHQPEVVFHLAAQPLVRESYRQPRLTYETNIMGTVNVLDAVRAAGGVRALLNITSDKCYENREWVWGYRENEALGGHDPYSSSKACAELVTAAYRRSFFGAGETAVASARGGNVIGGGDWATDRIVPDCVRALLGGEEIVVRNPRAVRPWQHVLEPLRGYLALGRRLCQDGQAFADAWNFGPDDRDARPVEWLVRRLCDAWGGSASYRIETHDGQPHEAHYLTLDCSKARSGLGWRPVWTLERAIDAIVEWTRGYRDGGDIEAACQGQIGIFTRDAA